MRRKLLAGNWKMNHLREDALRFAEALTPVVDRWADVDVVLFPPTTLLSTLSRALAGTGVRLGGQTCHWEREGAFTGELSATMLADAGCSFVLVGHRERRTLFGETDTSCARKVRAALEAGLKPVLCVGESQAERDAGQTEDVLSRQVRVALDDQGPDVAAHLVLAYEPVWAIGTGRTATPEMAQDAHGHVRERLAEMLGRDPAHELPILYGGSVKPDNIAALAGQPDIDGALVGGASLQAESFMTLIRECSRQRPRAIT